jgi:threonine/homoserine/homoserine lactone efflux protein
MSLLATGAALVALLLSPGPTNTLIAIGGATRGFWRALPLVWAAVAGYLAVIAPLALAGRPLLDAHPELATAVRILAAAWVMVLAVRLWSPSLQSGLAGFVTFRRVLVTTLLNPKALVIGLVLVPATTPLGLLPWLAGLAATIVAVAGLWLAGGALLGRATAGQLPPLLRRGTAGYLGFVAVGLAASAI